MTLNIQFGFRKNNHNDAAQVLTGNTEHFVDDRLVFSEEWNANHQDEEEEANPKYSQPTEADGKNKRQKAVARAKHREKRG